MKNRLFSHETVGRMKNTLPEAMLLFRGRPVDIDVQSLRATMEQLAGETEIIDLKADYTEVLSVKKYAVNQDHRSMVLSQCIAFMQPLEFEHDEVDGVLEGTDHYIDVCFPMPCSLLPYKQLAEFFLLAVEAALTIYPDCIGIYIPAAEKVTSPQKFFEDKQCGLGMRFMELAVNIRLSRLSDSGMLLDTVGFCSLGMPDVQVKFSTVSPEMVIRNVYCIAGYQFSQNFPLQNGDHIAVIGDDGEILPDIQWTVKCGEAVLNPQRAVIDINCGE